ncbi:CU044_5270 family protein [Actinomadura sp. BRA 177]|uniref:CU044_5270 family protein n=1 Tax=Actinomadura sp. BRA 177 TaxID=2745202 RepID=UPI001595D3B9|nr:CU044_5270 family protein [Actinomadura sp. BRA 177]NVI88435.1 CU044_5270 family protein [Actinomadura sp. BRA 177]
MRDVLHTLREARPAELDPDAPVDGDVRRAELAHAMAGAQGAPARRRVRPVWGLSLAGAVAAGAIVAATLVTTGGNPAGLAPQRGGEALDARTVLLAAAEKADGQTETMRAYWHQVTISSHLYMVGTGADHYGVVVRQKAETWTPSKPDVKTWTLQQNLGAKPATQADMAAWKRAGSPTTFEIDVPTSPKQKGRLKSFTAKTAPGRPEVSSSPLVDGDKVFWLGRNVTMKDLRSLPSDPKRLKAELLRWYKGHGTESNDPMSSDEWLYQVARGLVMDMPVKPEVRAAGFRMLAALPAVKSVGKVQDPQGRTGNAIAVDEKTPRGVIRHQLIIDLSTGTALASQNIMLVPAAGTQTPSGRTEGSTVTLTTEWTNSHP